MSEYAYTFSPSEWETIKRWIGSNPTHQHLRPYEPPTREPYEGDRLLYPRAYLKGIWAWVNEEGRVKFGYDSRGNKYIPIYLKEGKRTDFPKFSYFRSGLYKGEWGWMLTESESVP